MPQRKELYKDIEIQGRRWRIRKMDARTASYWLNKIMLTSGSAKSQGEFSAAAAKMLGGMSKADYADFQNDCLSVCFELQEMQGQIVPMPVLRIDGSWNVEGLDYDLQTVMELTMSGFVAGVSDDFFDEGGSKDSGLQT